MDLSWYLYPLFFFAGLLAGFINTLAGNGSVFTLSLLLFSGMPAGLANGTNRVGALVQCIVSIATFRNSNQFKPLLKNSAIGNELRTSIIRKAAILERESKDKKKK